MAELALSYMYGTWVWVETGSIFYCVSLSPKGWKPGGAAPWTPAPAEGLFACGGPSHRTRPSRYEVVTSSLRGSHYELVTRGRHIGRYEVVTRSLRGVTQWQNSPFTLRGRYEVVTRGDSVAELALHVTRSLRGSHYELVTRGRHIGRYEVVTRGDSVAEPAPLTLRGRYEVITRSLRANFS